MFRFLKNIMNIEEINLTSNAYLDSLKLISVNDEVILTSFELKEPYPNSPFIISWEAIIKPKLAGRESNIDSINDLFWRSLTFLKFFVLNAFERTGKETVPTAIPATAKFIW